MTYENKADEVLAALTHGPTPGVREWEIVESYVEDGKAYATLSVDGQLFDVEVKEFA